MKPPNRPDANATIQLDRVDRLDDILLDDEAPAAIAEAHGRSVPPPLPAIASLPAPLPPAAPPILARAQPPAPAKRGRTIAYGAVFVALLTAAIFGGLKMGGALRTAPAQARAPSAAPPPPPPATASPPSSAPANAVITMPTVEMVDPAADAQSP